MKYKDHLVGKGFSKKENTFELASSGVVLGSAASLIMLEFEKLDVKTTLSWRFKGRYLHEANRGF